MSKIKYNDKSGMYYTETDDGDIVSLHSGVIWKKKKVSPKVHGKTFREMIDTGYTTKQLVKAVDKAYKSC